MEDDGPSSWMWVWKIACPKKIRFFSFGFLCMEELLPMRIVQGLELRRMIFVLVVLSTLKQLSTCCVIVPNPVQCGISLYLRLSCKAFI